MPLTDIHPREHELAWELPAENLEEAAFMFDMREAALDLPHHTLATVQAGPERRLLAHVDALVLGGELVAERLLLPTLEDHEAEYEVIAAATLAYLEGQDRGRDEHVWLALEQAEDDMRRRGIARALELGANPAIEGWVARRVSDQVELREEALATYLDVFAARQVSPTQWLPALLDHRNPRIARAGATLVRFARPGGELLHALARLGDSADVDVRRATLESALCLALPGAWESTLYWALHPSDTSLRRDTLVWAACLGDAAVHTRILELVDDSERRVDAIWALGFCGRVAAVDRSMDLLDDEELGPLAAELVCAVAGLSRDEEHYWRAPASDDQDDDDELPSLVEDLETDLVPKSEAWLPIPEPEAIAAWWQARRPHFDPSLRYLNGHALDHARLIAELRDGSMRRRAPLAFELAVRSGAMGFVNTRASCASQLAQIDAVSRIDPPNYQRGYAGPLGAA